MTSDYGSTECEILISSEKPSIQSDIKTNDESKASTFQTFINMTKMCIGTGSLALPYAVNEGGILFYAFGLAIVALWNIYSTNRLLKCRQYMKEYHLLNKREMFVSSRSNLSSSSQGRRNSYKNTVVEERVNFDDSDVETHKNHEDNQNTNTSTFGKVTLFAFGNIGLQFVDAMMMTLMFGIVIAYEGKKE